MNPDKIQAFDPTESYSVVWRRLPHWSQAGTLCFITWRSADSMPRDVVERWIAERNELLRREGIVFEATPVSEKPAYTGGSRWSDLSPPHADDFSCCSPSDSIGISTPATASAF